MSFICILIVLECIHETTIPRFVFLPLIHAEFRLSSVIMQTISGKQRQCKKDFSVSSFLQPDKRIFFLCEYHDRSSIEWKKVTDLQYYYELKQTTNSTETTISIRSVISKKST